MARWGRRRGSVSTGYAKNYQYDPRLIYLSPPYYLNPGTSQWGFASFTGLAGSARCRRVAQYLGLHRVPVTGRPRRPTGNLGGRAADLGPCPGPRTSCPTGRRSSSWTRWPSSNPGSGPGALAPAG